MSDLRTVVIKLAKAVPELRKHLVPLLRKTAMEFPTEEARKKYLKDHPGADKSKHMVKKDQGGKGERPSGKKTKIHDLYRKNPILQDAFDKMPEKLYGKDEGYTAKPIKDLVKELKKKIRVEDVPALLEASERAYHESIGARSKAHQEHGMDSPEYDALEAPYAKAMNVWRAVRVLREESKAHPKSFGKEAPKKDTASNPRLKELGDKSEWTQAKVNTLKIKLKHEVEKLRVPSGPGYGPAKVKQKELMEAGDELSNWQLADSNKKRDTKTYKKKYSPKITLVMDQHNLTDKDADEVKAFKKSKPPSGAKLSPQQLMQRFLSQAKPETKKRMKDMTPAEFIKMLGAIMEEDV